jgi:flagellar basal body-associated protein FliL
MFEETKFGQSQKENKPKEKIQLAVVILLAAVGYYLFIYLNRKREEAKQEINKLFQQNPSITTNDLDNSLWKDKEN